MSGEKDRNNIFFYREGHFNEWKKRVFSESAGKLVKIVSALQKETPVTASPFGLNDFSCSYQCRAGTYLWLRRTTGSTSPPEDPQKQCRA